MRTQVSSEDVGLKGIRPQKGANAVRIWLLIIAAMVYAMILVGGATRLTDSGLSITEWKPVTGALPPMNSEHWAAEFEKYKTQTDEYKLQNVGMELSEFKYIYWWEWSHRLLGRLVGVVFLLPFLAFWALGYTTPKLRRRLWALFALGGLQGFIGWWMVSSGVGETSRVDVAPYRLMTHFSLALLIIGGCVWTWFSMRERPRFIDDNRSQKWAIILLVAASLQMMLGALVAGLDAGRTYTDWPMMDGSVVPAGYWVSELGLRNFFENVATVQFNHRVMAYILLGLSVYAAFKFPRAAGGWFKRTAHAVAGQSVLGVVTLLFGAPIGLGLFHQALGTIVLLSTVILVWQCSGQRER
ncbi:COX15/CtaA family protein [Hirschia baltica]|uniref:Heme A synthase n=1 Tax=Hirschia baltica (strain ATCC 49814 / DSM 5838 / IFAM 1418) TaxID=582402 RepID=C6XKK1_HIRBI|nr:COX15/CtaA family protein [Hirschia baltica]ACT59568.1 cytochrome oxidase assembly [Hirschia baltica ATCC 49814]